MTHDNSARGLPDNATRRRLLRHGCGLAGAGLLAPLASCAGAGAGPADKPPLGMPDGMVPMPLTATSVQIATRVPGDDAYPVFYRRATPPETPLARYPGFRPGTTLLRRGTVRRQGAMPLPCDILFDRDVAMQMRDGVTIYVDVFRPADGRPVPAILAFSPYGKEVGGQHFDDVPGRGGVPLAEVSELQRFEGPDPAVYVDRGYVVINPDPRGAYMSGGNVCFWGRQTGEDGYDIIEWAAAQPWCDGKVGMAGNSWLAISQWFIAAERPPHLAAMAPWEGQSDHFRQSALRGGVPFSPMSEILIRTFGGNQLVEDLPLMLANTDNVTPYWLDKAAALERIEAPAYVVASYTHPGHTHGTFDGFRRIASKQKWLRVHNTSEWHDFNDPEHSADLLRFFDHVLKGRDNGWQQTPRVRLSVIDQGGRDTVARPETDWPLQRQRHTRFFLAPPATLSLAPTSEPGSLRYAADRGGSADFLLPMTVDTEITGYMKLRLWVEVEGDDDMDLSVLVSKVDAGGRPLAPPSGPNGPFGATGVQRASRRELDVARSTASEPYLSFGAPQRLAPKQIVPLEIGLWPVGMRLRAGQQLKVSVRAMMLPPPGAFPFSFGEAKVPVPRDGGTFAPGSNPPLLQLGGPLSDLPPYVMAQSAPVRPMRNRGVHIVHFGGRFDSHLLVPIIPAG